MKFNLGKLITFGVAVGKIVAGVQAAHPNTPGVDKHEIARDAAIELLPALEGLTGHELNDAAILAALDDCIRAEKAVLTAKASLQAAIDSVKAKRAA